MNLGHKLARYARQADPAVAAMPYRTVLARSLRHLGSLDDTARSKLDAVLV